MITVLSLNPAVDKIFYIDDFKPGSLSRVRDSIVSPGGKGTNAARVAALLGERVAVLGFKAGYSGDWIESELAGLAVETHFIKVAGETRTNINIIDKKLSRETEILEYGPKVTCEQIADMTDMLDKLLSGSSVLVCSGGLADGMPVDFYRKAIEMAKRKGVRSILDASGDCLAEGIKAKPELVKPNLRELTGLTGSVGESEEEIINTARCLLKGGIETITVSLGSKGALAVSKETAYRAYPPVLDPVNTIGSGDSMAAGFAAGLERKLDTREVLLLGMACAAANTQFREIGYITRELVQKYIQEMDTVTIL